MTKARDLANSAAAFSAVSATELGYVDGVTSAIQTQIDGKQAVNANVSTTELGYLDGVTSAIQTQVDAKIAKTLTSTTGDIIYAGKGFTFDESRDAFIAPKPFNSWVLDEATCQWNSPIVYPNDGKKYVWNEELLQWKEITND